MSSVGVRTRLVAGIGFSGVTKRAGLFEHDLVRKPVSTFRDHALLFHLKRAGRTTMSATARLKHFGWGREGEGLTAEEETFVLARAEKRFGTLKESASAPRLDAIELPVPRVTAPASLPFCTSEHYDRAAHTYGKSYPELARAR